MMSYKGSSWIIALLNIRGIGRKTAWELVSNVTDPEAVDLEELINRNKEKLRTKEFSYNWIVEAEDRRDQILEQSDDHGIRWTTIIDDDYPSSLKQTTDPPLVLYYKGNIDLLNEKRGVAIIGTRKPTPHGLEIGKRLGTRFAEEDFNVVSGLAIGCDTAGHEGALAGSGYTTAVLAQPLDKIYPKDNRPLAERILSHNGVLVSEYAFGSRTGRSAFVERDRIQAGLSMATVVVETDVKGGTMHTVGFTLDYNRLLFAYYNSQKQGYHDNTQTKGNQLLISEEKAIRLSSEEDILNAARMIRNRMAHQVEAISQKKSDGNTDSKGQYNLKF
ncbi:MAG: DNA-processing protein DprA [Ekhidna sp.]|jgi:DNA processing protein|tara:strand:+ start:5434 stop:6426 length:993 start_codon:yes stop_codon:yes gene_type:complete